MILQGRYKTWYISYSAYWNCGLGTTWAFVVGDIVPCIILHFSKGESLMLQNEIISRGSQCGNNICTLHSRDSCGARGNEKKYEALNKVSVAREEMRDNRRQQCDWLC